MEAARKRLNNANLKLNTKLDKSNNQENPHRGIRKVTPAHVSKLYRLGERVMESTNAGMDVLYGTRLSDGLPVVVKTRKRPESFKSPQIEREWRRTTEVQLNMPVTEKLCQFYDVLETDRCYYIVMEKVEGEDLFELMAKTTPTMEDGREIVRQTLEALDILHKAGRIHKDIKIENLMVEIPDMESPKARRILEERDRQRAQASMGRTASMPTQPMGRTGSMDGFASMNRTESCGSPACAKLIDFDTVEDWEPSSPKAKEVLGTDGYIAPEAYLGEYSPASDIYAAGVVMYKVLTGVFPTREEIFDDRPGENYVGSPAMLRIHERLKHEVVDFTTPPFDKDTLAADLCAKLLKFSAIDRPSAEEALRHEWFFVEFPQ
mmetsp:Transcript_7949/g.16143  ORF Transcript_7949/g.16143 Transcript_7949/m.16143 type:complete len:377 (+) Transcript_7949:81-1211(+)